MSALLVLPLDTTNSGGAAVAAAVGPQDPGPSVGD